MAIEKAIKNYLLAKPAVTSLIGSRYWPDVVDQAWRPIQGPCLVYEFIDSQDQHDLADRVGFVSSRIKFIAYSETRATSNAVARAVKNSGIATMRGVYDGVTIRSVQVESGIRTDFEKPDDGSANYRRLTEFDIMVHYMES